MSGHRRRERMKSATSPVEVTKYYKLNIKKKKHLKQANPNLLKPKTDLSQNKQRI